jgi:predicted regulator of Ras-like GTPase activity (Roadblock/LC7/MglB family)
MFKEMLESILEHTEGSLGALIMGTDGIAVEKVLGEANDLNLDIAAAGIHFACSQFSAGGQRYGTR